MLRSEINSLIATAVDFFAAHAFTLPPFANYTPADWRAAGADHAPLLAAHLGWDITDFGSGDFQRVGLLLFTLRNDPAGGGYAEKIMRVLPGQLTPAHYHHRKTEDIINRAGGDLLITLWNAASVSPPATATTPVTLDCDGITRTVPAGHTLRLRPGQSVTLRPHLFHAFTADHAPVMVGEVSRTNDDATDNLFLTPVGRFPDITEDTAPTHLLVGDYAKWVGR